MMNSRGTKGLLFMAATMAAMGESFSYASKESHRFKRRGRVSPKSILTPKQLKVRARERKAKQARKLNRG